MTVVRDPTIPPLEQVLAHHGIKGQKWGVRRDRVGSGNVGEGAGDFAPLIAISAVYAGILANQVRKYNADSGKKFQKTNKDVAWKKDASLTNKMSVDDLHKNVVKQINPDFGAKGTQMNCRRCTFAYEMRRRGLDVKATPSDYAAGQNAKGLHKATDGPTKLKHESDWGESKISSIKELRKGTPESRSKVIFDSLDRQPEGSRGELGVGWTLGGGHSMAYEVVGGKATIFDTQSGITYKRPKDFEEFAGIVHDAAYTRLDNKTLNDDFLRRWAQNA